MGIENKKNKKTFLKVALIGGSLTWLATLYTRVVKVGTDLDTINTVEGGMLSKKKKKNCY